MVLGCVARLGQEGCLIDHAARTLPGCVFAWSCGNAPAASPVMLQHGGSVAHENGWAGGLHRYMSAWLQHVLNGFGLTGGSCLQPAPVEHGSPGGTAATYPFHERQGNRVISAKKGFACGLHRLT